jgi:hypothetical protein
MSWYVGQECEVCRRAIRQGWFWQPKPRLVASVTDARDVAYVSEADAAALRGTHVLACGDCYFHRFGEVSAAADAKNRGAGSSP